MIDVNDGRERVGFLKLLAGGGFELFLMTADDEIYIGKSKSMKQGATLVRAARAARAAAAPVLAMSGGNVVDDAGGVE
jgi:hypothetical protein